MCDVKAIKIREPRNISKLMALLFPLNPKFEHLKRVHNGIVLLTEDLDKIYDMDLKEIQKFVLLSDIITIKVPGSKPKTRAQYEEAKKYWPIAFHEDKILEKKINRNFFNVKASNILIQLYLSVEKFGGIFECF